MLKFVVIFLLINLLAVILILKSSRTVKEKGIWASILIAIPVIGIIMHYLKNSGGKKEKGHNFADI